MSLRWSVFNITELIDDVCIIRNTMTGAVVSFSSDVYHYLNNCILEGGLTADEDIEILMGENAILVPYNFNEVEEFVENFNKTRDSGTDVFTLHLLPTLQCQMACNYCFENGVSRKGYISTDTIDRLIIWLEEYFIQNNIKRLKVVLFGGEPLLAIFAIKYSLSELYKLSKRYDLDFSTELVTNAELLIEDTAKLLSSYNWRRVQITLDGFRDLHDKIRCNKNGRPTFDRIMKNILMLLDGGYIKKIDIRINYSYQTKKSVFDLLRFIASLNIQESINLSFGIIMSTFDSDVENMESETAKAYVHFCKIAKELGFEIPKEYTAGPWCVAVEKHSAVLQPNGALQKCISTVGRNSYDFSNVLNLLDGYARDERFERFERVDECRKEMCRYLPICGGGCPYDSLIKNGEDGFDKRYCQKTLFDIINRGLLRLCHE